jgi:signal transduction histidine kinase
MNVIANAFQAMAEGEGEKELTVETRAGDGRIAIVVKDTGPGIGPDQLEKVLEPLYSTKSFGVGLGLPIVKQIAEQHGGAVEIESQAGQGTAVALYLPLGQGDEK